MEHAYTHGELLVGEGDLAGALTAFRRGTTEESTFGRLLLTPMLPAARTALTRLRGQVPDATYAQLSRLAVDVAHCFYRQDSRQDRVRLTDDTLVMVLEDGHPSCRARAGAFLGSVRRTSGDPDGALYGLEISADAGDPQYSLGAAFDAGCLRHDRGELDLAEKWYRQVLATDHELAPTARYQLGRLLTDRGRPEEAADIVAELGPHRATVAARAAAALYRTGALASAETAFAEAATGDDPAATALAAFGLGTIRQLRGDVDGAAEAYQRVLAVGDAPTRAMALINLGELHAERGDIEAARVSYEQAIAIGVDEHSAQAAYNLGIRLQQVGDEAGAQQAYALAETFGDPDVTALARRRAGTEPPEERGFRLAAGGDRAGALAALTTAYDSAEVAEYALAVYDEQWETARAVLEQMAAGGDQARAARLAGDLATTRADAGDSDGAITILRALVAIAEPEQAAWSGLRLGELLAETGETEAASEAYERVAGSGFGQPAGIADFALYRLLDESGSPQARQALREMADTPGHLFATHAKLLEAVLQRDNDGDPDAALETMREAAESGDSYALFIYGQNLELVGRTAEAAELLERAAASGERGASEAALTLGVIAHESGDPDGLDRAHDWWLQAVDAEDPEVARKARKNLGGITKQRRDIKGAVRWFGPIAESDHADGPLAAAHIGELYYWIGDTTEASRWYRRTLEGTDDPALLAEAAFRVGEGLVRAGDLAGARPLLQQAIETGDEAFGSPATALLTELLAELERSGEAR